MFFVSENATWQGRESFKKFRFNDDYSWVV